MSNEDEQNKLKTLAAVLAKDIKTEQDLSDLSRRLGRRVSHNHRRTFDLYSV